jgi:hypothetical protein
MIYVAFLSAISLSYIINTIYFNSTMNKLFLVGNLLLLCSFISFNRWTLDYETYKINYQNFEKLKDRGYLALVKTLNRYLLPYESVLLILGFLTFIVLLVVIKNCRNNIYILMLYSVYPLALDITQTRNFYFTIFLLLSLDLLNTKNKLSYMFYALGCAFHRVGASYLPFFFLNKLSLKNFYRAIALLTLFNYCFLKFTLPVLFGLYPDKLTIYVNKKAFFAPSFLYYFIFILMDIAIACRIKKKSNSDIVLFKLAFYPLIFLPFFQYFTSVGRIYRNLFLMKFCYISKNASFRLRLLYIIYPIIHLFCYLYLNNSFELFKIFSENAIFYHFLQQRI